MSDKNKVHTPLSSAPNFDAMQVFPFHPDRVKAVPVTASTPPHPFRDDTDMVHFKVVIIGDTSAWPHINIDEWPHEAGNHYWGAVDTDGINISYNGDGQATVYIMEA